MAGIVDCAAIRSGKMAGKRSTPLERRMSALNQIRQWQGAAKTRRLVIAVLIGLPLMLALFLLASRFASRPVVAATVVASMVAIVFFTWRSTRGIDTTWLIRQLDQRVSNIEDSSDLMFKPGSELSTLQNLQRERIEQRISRLTNVDLREAWPTNIIALSFLIAITLSAAALFWPQSNPPVAYTSVNGVPPAPSAHVPTRLVEQSISIRAPTYTGRPTRSEKTLRVKFPEGSTLSWNLKLQPEPTSVDLVFYDGSHLVLKKNGEYWQGSKVLLQSSLYRVQVNNAPLVEDKLYRLDAIKDLPPQLRVLQPDRNLSLVELGQTDWALSFEAEDDYGLGSAQLRIQLAKGSGENIKFSEQTRAITGQGSRTRKRFAQTLDLTALGLAAGDDVIVQFGISDQRSPQNNTTRSSSFILRWPPEDSVEASGVEGLVQKAIPAYFRSQRQIIIDTEKLLAERKKYSAENFAIQSDTIGVDQRILRLRYGQFLGEEAEDASKEHDEHTNETPGKAATANDTQSILEQYGHTHDIPEAATLLEPKTKELLRAALNEMWQAELHLRSGQPKQALPFEYRALAFIKKVQQADRIYLARVGLELPPIDESRRLSGDRSPLKNREDFLQAANNEDAALIQFWQSLDRLELSGSTGDSQKLDFNALRNWIREHPSRSPDALGLLAALDALEKQPACKNCLAEMKAQLWPMLSKPPARPEPRVLQNTNGNKYLDALIQEHRP
jgi:hypothetical protein